MATKAEYGPALQQRITPLMTGVGPVEAAITLTATLASLSHAGALPDRVLCLGSAGSASLPQGSIHQVSQVSYRDMDATSLGFAAGITPFLDLPAQIPLPQIDTLPSATLATGASVVSGDHYAGITADMVDMETFAILRACQRYDLPLYGLRGISDGSAPLKGITCWTDLLPVLDARLADAVEAYDAAL